MKINFWKTFYKIRYYPSLTRKQTGKEIKFLREFLPIRKHKNLLDFICGFGRHTIALAKIGYAIEGFDIDKESIRQAKKAMRAMKLKNIKLYVKNALKFQKQKTFDAAICLYSSIGFLDEKSNQKVFNNLFRCIKDGGRVVIDLMNPDWAIKHLVSYSERKISYKERIYFVRHKRRILYNPTREENVIEFFDSAKNKKYITSYTLRLYSLKELREKLRKNHFKINQRFGSFDKKKISRNYQRIIIVADKSINPMARQVLV